MVNSGLVAYLRNGLNQGYRVEVLRNYLLNQGYPQQEVDTAITALYQGEQPNKNKFFVLVGVMVCLLFLAGGITYFFSQQDASPVQQQIRQISTPTQTAATPTKTQTATATSVPSAQTSIQTQTHTASQSQIPVSPPSTQTTTTSLDKNEVTELLRDVRSVNDCSQLGQKQDRCILEFSYVKDHVAFCEDIGTSSLKDECYSRYALRHEDKQYCQSIENRYSKEICEILLRTAKLLREQGTKYTLDPIEGKILYNQQQAISDLEQHVKQTQSQEQFGTVIPTQITTNNSVSTNASGIVTTSAPPNQSNSQNTGFVSVQNSSSGSQSQSSNQPSFVTPKNNTEQQNNSNSFVTVSD